MESLSLHEASKLYIALLKERFKGTTAETFNKFQEILDHVAESETVDRTILFSEVNALFTKHHDLIENFRYFLNHLDHNRASSVESNGEDIPLIPNKIPNKESVVRSCVDFMNRVKTVLKDDNKFKSFMMMITGFQRHKDVKRVEREADFLFNEHPELKIEFSEILADANARKKVVSEKHKRKEAEKHTETDGHRKWSDYETKMFEYEDGLYKKDLGYNTMLRAKEAAERLITDNLGNENLKETIWIASYFSGLNLKFLKGGLKIKSELLTEKSMKREKAISTSQEFVRFVEKGIKILTRSWNEEKKRLDKMSREADLQIPVFDWRAGSRDVNESGQAQLLKVRLCSFTTSPIYRALNLYSDSSSIIDCDIRAFSTFIVRY